MAVKDRNSRKDNCLMRTRDVRNRWIGVRPENAVLGSSIQGAKIIKISDSVKKISIPKKCRAIRGRTMQPGEYVFVLAQIPASYIV